MKQYALLPVSLCMAVLLGLLVAFGGHGRSRSAWKPSPSPRTSRSAEAREGVRSRVDRTDLRSAQPASGRSTADDATPVERLEAGANPRFSASLSDLTSDMADRAASAAMRLAESVDPEQVDALLARYRDQDLTPRSRALLLFVLARSRSRFAHIERDVLLDGGGLELLRALAMDRGSDAMNPAILTLGALGSEEASAVLAAIGRDAVAPDRAANALMSLARFPSRAGIEALQALAVGRGSHAAQLRAISALIAAVHLAGGEHPSPAVLVDARCFLMQDGDRVASRIEREASIPSVRREAWALRREITALR